MGTRSLACLTAFAAACGPVANGEFTVAEIEVIRPAVSASGKSIGATERVGEGSEIAVAEGGRAWLKHDAATRMLLDSGAKVVVLGDGVRLDAGRLWVDAGEGERAHLVTPFATIDVAGAGFEAVRRGDGLHLTVARGELTYHLTGGPDNGDQQGQVRAGESADLSAKGVEVKAETLWDDWTGGLAWPDPGHSAPRTLGELGARRPGSLGEARFPLAITRLEVRASVVDDLATTQVVETFFNPASDTLEGLYWVRIPDGALLERFAIDRDGRWADGYVKERQAARAQYQAQVYEGSTKNPALLEWEAPGSFRARIYPIPAGATRRVLLEYSQWLTPHGDGMRERTWRLPMAEGADGPVIQELDVELDGTRAVASQLRAGLGARVEGQKVLLERTDFRPRADLVVDLVGAPRGDEARGYRSPHHVKGHFADKEDDYFLALPVPLPLEAPSARPPLDVVIVTDVSAGTDATHLQMARTVVDSLVKHLDDKDRIAVVGADLDLHPLPMGPDRPKLAAATRAVTDRMLDALARASTGGATDLGATLTAAGALLEPGRRGAVIYVGDGAPTVGELDLASLRDRLDRLPAPVRLYGVAIGDDADLALLSGLASDGGLAMRVDDRVAAADAALKILGHLSRRALFRAQVDCGAGVDRLYPRRPVAVVEGEPLPILARVRTGVPLEVTLTGLLDGKPFSTKRHIVNSSALGDDLRLRWSSARLNQLLAEGGSAEEVAELGVRQNLITPFTSYYVPSADELGPPTEEEEGRREEHTDKVTKFLHSTDSAARPATRRAVLEQQVERSGILGLLAKKDQEPPAPPATSATTAAAPPPIAVATPSADPSMPMPMGGVAGNDKSLRAGDDGAFDSANGVGGLHGTGRGGGGNGEGTIGLGDLGSIGRGSGSGYGSGNGRGPSPDVASKAPRQAEEKKEKGEYYRGGDNKPASHHIAGLAGRLDSNGGINVSGGAAQVSGAMPGEVISRIVKRHLNEVRYCYEQGLRQNPSLRGRVAVRFTIGPDGRVGSRAVDSSTLGGGPVEQCILARVGGWEFPRPTGGSVSVVYPFVFSPTQGARSIPAPRVMLAANGDFVIGRRGSTLLATTEDHSVIEIHIGIVEHKPKHCSAASLNDLSDRVVLWKERLTLHGGVDGAMEVWQDASSTCELKTWSDRRALLRAMLSSVGGASQMVLLYRRYDDSPTEQDFLRRALLGQVRTAADLRVVYDGLGLSEDVRWTLVEEVLAKAKSPEALVVGLEQLLAKWPEDLRLKLKMIEALESVHRIDDARRLAEEVRKSPSPDAQARTLVGEFLVRQGDEPAARRAFSEIVEFAPRDPLARRRLGDLYRAHGWFEEAHRQYQTLAQLAPGDASVNLLDAAAAAGAGRTDEALRLEQRLTESTEPGSEAGIARVALWWSTLRQLELREAARNDPAELARLMGRARRTGVLRDARPFRAYLTWAHPEADCELSAQLPGGPLAPATDVAPEFGIELVASRDPLTQPARLVVKRNSPSAALRYGAQLTVVWNEGEKDEAVQKLPLEFKQGVSGFEFLVDGRKVVKQ